MCRSVPIVAIVWATALTGLLWRPGQTSAQHIESTPTDIDSVTKVPLVAVLRRSGLRPYEQVVEEIRNDVRADVQVLGLENEPSAFLSDHPVRTRPDLFVAIGQQGYDFARANALEPLVYTYVYRTPPAASAGGVPTQAPLRAVLRAFRSIRPQLRRLGLLSSHAGTSNLRAARAIAARFGIKLVVVETDDPARAISGLRAIDRTIQGLWLEPNPLILTHQVVQYAIALQFRRRIPLMGATRGHVMQGALFALDYPPEVLGRQLARLARKALEIVAQGYSAQAVSLQLQPDHIVKSADWRRSPRLSTNGTTARHIGIPIERLPAGTRVDQ